MAPLDPALRDGLNEAAAALGLDLPAGQADTLLAYLSLLQRWNGTYNLTSVREPLQMLSLHLADCLALVAPLRRHLGARTGARLLDVGSGAGLPGVVIAALNRSVAVTCVETVGKKAAFVQQVAAELGLQNLSSTHARVERLNAAHFDIVCSRAFASLPDFVTLTRSHVAPGGVWLAMKGKRPDDELARLASDIDVFHVEQLAVPGLDAERCLVWMRPRP
jgi:16S rRNA (guanine527-N7)-methyltransferase